MSSVAIQLVPPCGTGSGGTQYELVEHSAELAAVLAGSREAWERFYLRFNPFITACVSHVLRGRNIPFGDEDLADFVAEVWVSLLRHDALSLRRYDPARGRSVSSWIRLLATRSTIDQLRGRSAQQRLREVEDEVDRPADENTSPDIRVETLQRARAASEALAQLKHRDRQFIEMCLDDQDASEVARRLGIAVSTVHSRRFKLSQKLHRLVRQQLQHSMLRRAATRH